MNESPFRVIPSVEKAMQALTPVGLPRPVAIDAIRRELSAIRDEGNIPDLEEIMSRLKTALCELRSLRLQPVINATGIPLHTNLGRAPLASSAIEAVAAVSAGYSNLEYDLQAGQRGSRGAYLERCLALLCEAEAATVVNNCAAALVLILRHFAGMQRREIIISRGELIQIGGGFRIPEILEASSARLREVGTTNRTTVEDYASALGGDTALILKVHRSNFHMEGFVESASREELAALAVKAGIPLVEDLGSGDLGETKQVPGLEGEPTPAEVLRRGVDLVCFSGDKLLGGPQAGIIAGKATLVAQVKEDPLFRALRCDKLVFAALQETAEAYLSDASDKLPLFKMLATSNGELRQRAEHILTALGVADLSATIEEVQGEVGGGTLPRCRLSSIAISLAPRHGSIDSFSANLRRGVVPLIGYIVGDRLLLDLRTVFPEQDDELITAIQNVVRA